MLEDVDRLKRGEEPLIRDSGTRSRAARLIDLLFTLCAWFGFMLLFRDGLALLWNRMSLFGTDTTMPVMGHFTGALPSLLDYGLVILINGFVLLVWARWNQIRFRGRERREAQAPLRAAEVASEFEVPRAVVQPLTEARRIVLHHGEHGSIDGIDSVDFVWRRNDDAIEPLLSDEGAYAGAPAAGFGNALVPVASVPAVSGPLLDPNYRPLGGDSGGGSGHPLRDRLRGLRPA